MKSKNKKFLLIIAFALLFFGFVYVLVWQTEINKAYEWPYEVAKGAQQGLDAGISPNGVIEEVTGETDKLGDLWEIDFVTSEPDDFIYVQETAKEYETSSKNINTDDVNVADDFIQETQAQSEARTKLRLPNGNRYAVQSFSYSYGDVRGVVLVGRLNKPDQEKIDLTRNIAIVAWVIIAGGAYAIIKPLRSRK